MSDNAENHLKNLIIAIWEQMKSTKRQKNKNEKSPLLNDRFSTRYPIFHIFKIPRVQTTLVHGQDDFFSKLFEVRLQNIVAILSKCDYTQEFG